MTGAFAYLTVCSMRNSVRTRVRRLRQPRYLVIALGFVLYVGSMMIGRPPSGAFGFAAIDTVRAWTIAVTAATLLLATAWVLPVGAALRFTNAEILFLFPAPLTRRQLIGYKLVRVLLGSAFTGAFLTVFIGPHRLGPALFFAAKCATVMVLLTLHGVGVATYRTNVKEVGRLPGRRWPIIAAACLLTPVAGAALVFVAFSSATRFMAAFPLAALIVAVNTLWIIRTDTAFEDAATETADKINRALTTGQAFAPRLPRTRTSLFRLAPRGRAETAILWKNWLLLGRGSRQALITSVILLTGLVTMFLFGTGGVVTGDVIGDISMFAVALIVALGPAMLRIDLRQDLAHLVLIKTWPVRGAALLRGELLAPAIALSLCAAAAIVVGSAAAPALLFVDEPTTGARVAFAISAVLALTAVILTQLVVHNGIAAAFPAWVELKPATGAAAMETNVRMMIVMYGSLILVALAVLIPGGPAFLAYLVTGGLVIPSAVFSVLLTGECLAATEIVGRILDRTDLQDVVVTE